MSRLIASSFGATALYESSRSFRGELRCHQGETPNVRERPVSRTFVTRTAGTRRAQVARLAATPCPKSRSHGSPLCNPCLSPTCYLDSSELCGALRRLPRTLRRRRDGALSLITVGTRDGSSIFLFDALRLSAATLQPLFTLLASPSVMQVVWDGRTDDLELRRSYGIGLGRPLDLQIVDIIARTKIPSRDGQSAGRLALVSHMELKGIHVLGGLKHALQNRGVQDSPGWDLPKIDHTQWLERPLAPAYLQHAHNDVLLLARVLQEYQIQGLISLQPEHLQRLEIISLRYVRMHPKPIAPKLKRYAHTNILPLEILELPRPGSRIACDKCKRVLARQCFVYAELRNARETLRTSCKVCNVVEERMRAVERRLRQKRRRAAVDQLAKATTRRQSSEEERKSTRWRMISLCCERPDGCTKWKTPTPLVFTNPAGLH
ncbi:hypothetical protein BKA62DRAFT_180356 [Auriculariales sp. MPI-PUGE-AT-0066]|nr:hypothetical protein BKA62DRAFT_180356 [Auriculariales sp. MPI-PUGE-AT-0066]